MTDPTQSTRHTTSRRTGTQAMMEQVERRVLLSAVDVLTFHNDNTRDGENLHETVLTPSNVNTSQFGKVATFSVDGQVYAQPLYVSHVMFPGHGGVMHNVVYVATEGDDVYAFDASGGGLLWHDRFTDPADGITTVPAVDTGITRDLSPQFGITSTPVIDQATNTMYVVANLKEVNSKGTFYIYRLYALNLVTGAKMDGGPVQIKATYPGTGDGSADGMVSLSGLRNLQRVALTLTNNTVYIGFSSHGDYATYHGWVIGYNATTLKQNFVWVDTPDARRGGIWMDGGGIAVDSEGNIYFSTGDGVFDANTGGDDYGDSLLKFAPGATTPTDYFTPNTEEDSYVNDLDMGSGGVILVPSTTGGPDTEAICCGKLGNIYVVNLDNMGRFDATENQITQELPATSGGLGKGEGSWDTPAYFDGNVYYVGTWYKGITSPLVQYSLTNGLMSDGQIESSTAKFGYPGGSPSISANGDADGIVWNIGQDSSGNAVLYAFDATDVSKELYNSDANPKRDQAGVFNKFAPPTIANGRVYVAAQGEVDVYGLLK
jgi:hypothetical protein